MPKIEGPEGKNGPNISNDYSRKTMQCSNFKSNLQNNLPNYSLHAKYLRMTSWFYRNNHLIIAFGWGAPWVRLRASLKKAITCDYSFN